LARRANPYLHYREFGTPGEISFGVLIFLDRPFSLRHCPPTQEREMEHIFNIALNIAAITMLLAVSIVAAGMSAFVIYVIWSFITR